MGKTLYKIRVSVGKILKFDIRKLFSDKFTIWTSWEIYGELKTRLIALFGPDASLKFLQKNQCQIWRKSIYLAFDLFVLLKHCVADKISPLNKSTYIIKRTAHGQRPHVPFGACANEANSWKKAVRFVRIICSKLALHSPFFFNATIKLESVLSHTYSKSLNLGFFDDENNLMSVWNVERFSNPLTKLKLTLPNLGQRSTLILVLNH